MAESSHPAGDGDKPTTNVAALKAMLSTATRQLSQLQLRFFEELARTAIQLKETLRETLGETIGS